MELFKRIVLACLLITILLPSLYAQQNCSVIEAIYDVDMFLLGNQLVVVWQEPDNAVMCNFTNLQHTVTYTGYETEVVVTTEDYYVYFDYSSYRCVPSVITITAHTGNLTSATTSVEYYTETSEVEDLTLQQDDNGALIASWTEPENSEFCNFVYQVTYDDGSNNFMIETPNLSANLSVVVSSCVYVSVSVTPVNGAYTGISKAADYEGEINPVRNYVLSSSEGEVIAQFDPPLGIEYCNITYEVREIESDCYTKVVNVAAYNGRIFSPWVSDVIEYEIPAPGDLTATIGGGTINVSWNEPQSASSCSIVYLVTFGESFTTTGTNVTLSAAALAPCVSSSISVSAVSNSGKIGLASEVQIKPDLGAVQNLTLTVEDAAIVANWAPPANSSSCTLSYLLEYTNESGVHLYLTDDTRYTFEYTSCISVTLSVTPNSADGSEGSKSTFTHVGSC